MENIEQILSDLRVDAAESRIHLQHIAEHLAKLNGRTEKCEDKVVELERNHNKIKTIWGTVVALSSFGGALLSWAYKTFVFKE
jgi:hypothetical protein